MRAWIGWLALVWLLFAAGSARADDLPPAPSRHVEDHAGVMSSAALAELDDRLARLDAEGGHQIVVWIAESIGARTIEDFAADAFSAWKIGRAGRDDGVALFVVTGAREVRIEVGYGVEDRLTDLLAAQIVRDAIVPRLRAGDFDGGIASGVEAIAAVVEGRPDALPAASTSSRGPPDDAVDTTSWVVLAIVGVAFLVLLFTRPHLALFVLSGMLGGRGGRGGSAGFHGGGGRSGGGGATGRW
ncbi:MAG TPA: TPM domain-containing protein [Nannocystaceae bacterium]|nr:TPM domain-containing protein [Nannocystaceae bacterium]